MGRWWPRVRGHSGVRNAECHKLSLVSLSTVVVKRFADAEERKWKLYAHIRLVESARLVPGDLVRSCAILRSLPVASRRRGRMPLSLELDFSLQRVGGILQGVWRGAE